MKLGQNTYFDDYFPKIKQKFGYRYPFVYFWTSLLFYCLQTKENNRKTIGTIVFEFFFAQSKSTVILGILTKFGEIITTLAHFMADSLLTEIYSNYIGFTQFRRGSFQ